MFCPNENAKMHQAAVSSHYGQQVIIDQCEKCGGIWFDAFELYKAQQGEAQEIEELDPDIFYDAFRYLSSNASLSLRPGKAFSIR